MQRPLIENGKVVNVAEIESDTLVVSKVKHYEMLAKEDADYAARFEEWRELANKRGLEIGSSADEVALRIVMREGLKTVAQTEADDTKVANLFRQLTALEVDIAAREAALLDLRAQTLPERPKLVRRKRWFPINGYTVGPEGGNIGDLWDGKVYTRPEKVPEEANVDVGGSKPLEQEQLVVA